MSNPLIDGGEGNACIGERDAAGQRNQSPDTLDTDLTRFVERLRGRLETGACTYGDASFERPLTELIDEITASRPASRLRREGSATGRP